MPKILTQNGLTIILVAVVMGLVTFVYGLTSDDGMKLAGKAIALALYWSSQAMFITFWRTRSFNVEAFISENPLALSVFLGLFTLGSALVVIAG